MQVVTLEERPDLLERLHEPDLQPPPEFIYHDPVSVGRWRRLETDLADHQVVLLDAGEPVAKGYSVPLQWNREDAALPDEGWDFALTRGIDDLDAGRPPNVSCALWAVVRTDRLGAGLSQILLDALRVSAAKHGFSALIAPVRPIWKARYPLIEMEKYVRWKNSDGAPFDPWLRVHWRLGGRIIKVCPLSMTVPGTVNEWEAWTGLTMPASGRYVVPDGLVPMELDCDRDRGLYVEPNVWVKHDLQRVSVTESGLP